MIKNEKKSTIDSIYKNTYVLSKIDKTKPVLFVDLSYMCFTRFYGIQCWWKNQKQNKNLDVGQQVWETNKLYMDKYKKTFFDKLEIILKKRQVPYNNIIFARDCHRSDIWRMDHYPQYKGTREESHRRNKFNGQGVFSYTYKHLISDFIKKHGIKLLSNKRAEADDLIAVSCKYLRQLNPNMEIIIVANDNDYMQLVDLHLKIVDIKNKNLSDIKVKDPSNSKYELMIKILMGDRSDNIPACYILTEAIKTIDSRKQKSNIKYLKCYPFIANKYASDPDLLKQHINKYPNLIRDNQFNLNCQLIDFNYIPDYITSYVNKCIDDLYH